MHTLTRFLIGVGLGGGALAAYLWVVGIDSVLAQASATAPWAAALVVALVPFPQAASVVPVPGSIGAYDVLLSGALVVATGAPVAATAAAVLVVRTVSLPFGLSAGGLSVAFLRGWRPRSNRV